MRDEVNEPLGRTPPAPSRAAALARRFGPRLALGLAVAAVGVAAFAVVKSGDRRGGEPFAIARIEEAALAPPPAAATAPAAALPSVATGDQIEAASGVKVVRSGGGGSTDALIIDVPQALGVHLAAAPDPRLVEKSRTGLLPRVGADGARPADVYARPIVASGAAAARRAAPRRPRRRPRPRRRGNRERDRQTPRRRFARLRALRRRPRTPSRRGARGRPRNLAASADGAVRRTPRTTPVRTRSSRPPRTAKISSRCAG